MRNATAPSRDGRGVRTPCYETGHETGVRPGCPVYRGRMRGGRTLSIAGLVLISALGSACAETGAPSRSPAAQSESGAPATVPDASTTQRGPLPRPLADALDDGPRRGASPQQVARQIEAAEDAIADPATPPDVLAAAGHLQQLAYRQLGARPEWDREVLARVPPRYSRVVNDNVRSRREFRSLQGGALSDTLPAWRIVRPEPARRLLSSYLDAERRFGVGWEYLAAINLVETGMGRIRGTSVAGAQGPMQFIPSTWAAYGRGDIDSPRDAIAGAARYLRASGFNNRGGVPGALFAYNNSSAYVRGVTLLAQVMERRPRAFLGYYHWQIYYVTARGDVVLPEGYASDRSIPVKQYLADNPR